MQGFVTSVDRGRYGCMASGRLITAMKARELGRRAVVVGDRVALAGDTSGEQGSLARIVRVEPRTSVLRRSADDTDPAERVIVANADQLVIVCALAQPPPRLRFVDRCLVAAYDAGLDPLILLTKADLASPRRVRAFYAPLGLPMLTTRRPLPPRTLSRLRSALAGRVSVLIGQSGVGKSTLVNILVPADTLLGLSAAPAAAAGSRQTATPRQMKPAAGRKSVASAGSKAQSSRPVSGSRATTRSKGVHKTSLPSASTGVPSKELLLKAAPRRAASPVW